MIAEPYTHRAQVPPDDGSAVVFRWHFPSGTLRPRMSALELGLFLLGHMPAIVPLLADHPRVQSEFAAMLTLFATLPTQALDDVLPWVQSVDRGLSRHKAKHQGLNDHRVEEDDIVVLNLNCKVVQPRTRKIFY